MQTSWLGEQKPRGRACQTNLTKPDGAERRGEEDKTCCGVLASFTVKPLMMSAELPYIRDSRYPGTYWHGIKSTCVLVLARQRRLFFFFCCFSAQIDYMIDSVTHLHAVKLLSLQENGMRITLWAWWPPLSRWRKVLYCWSMQIRWLTKRIFT